MHKTVDKRAVLTVFAGLVVLAFAAWFFGGGALPLFKHGPVIFQSGEAVVSAGIAAESGAGVIFGGNRVENTGDKDARLTSARLVGDVDSSLAEVTEVRVLRISSVNDEIASFGAGNLSDEDVRRSWDASEPIGSLVVAPDEVVTLVFRVAAHKEVSKNEWGWPKTELTYSVNGRDHVTESHFGFYICHPTGCE